MRRTLALSALTLTLAFTGTACGDDGDSSEAASATPAAADADGPDLAAWCRSYLVLSEIDPAATEPETLEANLVAWQHALDRAVQSAPEEMAEPTAVIAERFDEYVAEADAASYEIGKVDVNGFFEAEDIAAASSEIDPFAENNCA